jgi:hypothetical protein
MCYSECGTGLCAGRRSRGETSCYNIVQIVKIQRGDAVDLYRAIGLFGAALFVGAYFATQQRWLNSDNWRYPAINLAGSLLVTVSLFAEWNLPSVVLEAFWAAISVYGLLNRA